MLWMTEENSTIIGSVEHLLKRAASMKHNVIVVNKELFSKMFYNVVCLWKQASQSDLWSVSSVPWHFNKTCEEMTLKNFLRRIYVEKMNFCFASLNSWLQQTGCGEIATGDPPRSIVRFSMERKCTLRQRSNFPRRISNWMSSSLFMSTSSSEFVTSDSNADSEFSFSEFVTSESNASSRNCFMTHDKESNNLLIKFLWRCGRELCDEFEKCSFAFF